MRVFVTGATGFIGSAVVQELISAGHQVLGLARSDAAAAALARSGVEAHHGDLSDLESLAAGARACEGVIHLAFVADFSTMTDNLEKDRRAIETLAGAVAGAAPALVAPSVTLVLAPGHLAQEEDVRDPGAFGAGRAPSEDVALAATSRGVRASVVRLPASVHGDGDHGLAASLIRTAREKGESAYVADGENRWPAVHRLDAAHLFRLALEQGSAGARYHAVAEAGVPFRQIAEVIGRRLNVPVVSKCPQEAADHFGFLAQLVGSDVPVSSAETRDRVGWRPTQPGLIADLDRPSYYAT